VSTAVFTFGRMNPPTIGHQKLVDKVSSVAKTAKAKDYVFLSHTQNNKKDPLNYDQKIAYAKKAFGNSVTKSRSKTIIQVMQELEKKGHAHIIMVVGSDRVTDFDTLLKKYNGKEYTFSSIQVVSAGERDPDAEGASGMSASKMRAAAQAGDENKFKKGLPPKLRSSASKIFNDVRSIMEDEHIPDDELEIIEHWEVPEEMLYDEEQLDENREPLTVQQRRKIGLRMRRLAPRMQRLKKMKAKRMAPADRLKTRARKAAINLLRKRAAGKSGANYATLSTAQKIAVDKMIMKKRPAIANIAKRLFPKVRKKEMERLQKLRKGKQNEEKIVEATQVTQDKDISKRGGTQPAKYHKGLSKDTKAKRDAQFKKQATMSDDNPAAYKPAPGDASAKTKLSKFTKAYRAEYGEDVTRADVKAINVREPDGKIAIRKTRKDVKVEDANQDAAKARIKREKEADKQKHDRMMDRARTQDTRTKNRQTEEVNEMAQRGRPKKSGEVGIEQIQMQLRKVISLNGQRPVEFEDGKKLKMTPSQARTIDKKISQLRMPKDKHHFVQFITKSADNMKKALDPKFTKPEQFKSYLMNAVKESKARAMNEKVETPSERVRFRHFSEEVLLEKAMAGLQKKAEKSGISYGTLKKVYDRGVAAWRTGHRPGTTPSQWGFARVNAFITKKKNGGLNHDKDLA